MKQLNFLSKSGSQSGSHRVVTLASTVGSPSAHRRGIMLKLLSVLVLVLTFGVGQMWGDSTPGTGYTLVTNISSLSTGDKVILFCNQNGEGVTGQSNKDATASTTKANWVEYKVTKSNSSFTLKDEGANKFIKQPTGNEFYYDASTGGACTVSNTGLLTCNSRYLFKNGNYYRFYSTSSSYTNKFYVYKVSSSVAVTGVSVSPTSKAIVPAETFDITPTVTPSNASNKNINWSTSNSSKATVSNGTVTGVAAGTATITATSAADNTKTATCAVTVYGVTMQARDEDGNTIPSGGPGAPSRTGKSISPAADANNYVFKEWSISGASLGSSKTTKSNTITNPEGTVTITAVYYKPIIITYLANGQEFTTQTYGHGGTLAFPASGPNGDTYSCTGKTFVGWVAETNKDYSHATDAPTYAAAGGSVTTEATYYAVFATADEGEAVEGWQQCNTLDDFVDGDFYLFVSPEYNNTHYYVPAPSSAVSQEMYSSTADGNQVASNSNPTSITKAQGAWKLIKNSTSWKIQSSNASTIYLYSGTNNNKLGAAAAATASSTWSITKHASSATFAFQYNSSRYLCAYNASPYGFRTYTGTSTNGTAYLTVYHWVSNSGTTYSNYETTCCQELGTIGGSVSVSNQRSLTLQWNKLSGVDGTTPYTITCKQGSTDAGTIGDVDLSGAKATCTVTGLDCGTTYTFTITAHGDASHCDKMQENIQGTTSAAMTLPTLSYTTPLNAGGSNVNPSWASAVSHDGSVTYTSSNSSVLQIINASTGEAKPVGAGTATITATYAQSVNNCEASKTSNTITVNGNVSVTFNANGGGGSMDNQSIPVSTATALTANAFTTPSSCKYFYGWATSQANADAGTRAYTDGQSVTITEGLNLFAIWKSYNYTVTKGTGTGAGTFSLSASNVDCGGSITVTATPDATHKGNPIVSISPSDKGTVSGTTISNITAAITVNVEFAAKESYAITWKVKGVALTGDALTGVTTSVLESNGIENLPSVSNSALNMCITEGCTFKGWSESEIKEEGQNAPDDLFSDAAHAPSINGAKTFHAVFAKQIAGEEEEDQTPYSHTIASKTWSATGAQTLSGKSWTLDHSATKDATNYNYDATKGQQVGKAADPVSMMSLSTSAFSGKIKAVKITTSGASSVVATVGVSVGSTAFKNGNNTTVSISASSTEYTFTGSASGTITITWSNSSEKALYFKAISVEYATVTPTVTYQDYMTGCCEALADINGTVSWSNPTTAVLTWDNIAHVSSWAVKYKKHADANYSDFAGSITGTEYKTCTISSLVCGTDYDFQIIATADDGYCDKSQMINDTQAHKYAITLDPANGEVTGGSFLAADKACDGDDVDLLAEAATGYAFNGWTITKASSGNVSPAANTEETTFEMPAEAVTVSAAFSLVNYTITYANMEGATNHVSNPATYTINSAAITLGDPEKDGFDFGGWFTDGDLAPEHAVGTPAIAAGSHENKTFYAKWTQTGTHIVTIADYSNGTVSVTYTGMESALTSGSRTIEENTVLTITATPNTGYEGLLTVNDVDFTSGSTHTLVADIAIEALFEPKSYTITYKDKDDEDYSGSNLASLPTSHTYNTATALVDGVKAGHSFGGWFTDAACTESAGSSLGATAYTDNITLYAKWEEITMYSVTWMVNGAAYTTGTPTVEVEAGDAISNLPTAPEVCDEDLTFMGWTNAAIEGTQVGAPAVLFTTAGAAPAVTGNVTYHAVFAAANQLTATFNAADISNLTENYDKQWTHTSAITLTITSGQRYTGSTKTFTVNANSNCYLTSTDGVTIKKVILTCTSADYLAASVSPGTLATSGTTQTITSVNDEYLYIYASTSDQIRITNIDVKYTSASPTYSNYRTSYAASVPTPTLDVASGKYTSDQLVTIDNYDGNYIYFYTTNGSTPAADANLEPISPAVAYDSNDGIEITSTKTVKVIAYDLCHNASAVTTATYTIAESLTLAEFVEQKPTTNEKVDFTGAIVMAREDKRLYVQKDAAAMCLYYEAGAPSFAVGKQIANGIITGHYDADDLEMKVSNAGSPTATVDGVMPTPLVITDDNAETLMVEANMYRYAQMNSVTLDEDEYSYLTAYSTTSDKHYYYDDWFEVLTSKTLPLSTTECSVKGIITPYYDDVYYFDQLSPILANDISTNATAVLPTFSDLGGADAAHAVEVAEGKEITITENADFDAIYQINDGDETAINTSAVVTITNTAAATKVYVKASRDYYADNTNTYYYIANSALTEHTITCATGLAGGSISADKSAAVTGATVTLTPTPAEHYHLTSWTVTYNDGEEKTINVVNNQFTMPGYNVNVTATFTEDAYATVSFAKGDEAVTGDVPANQKVYVGDNATMPANPFTFSGHNFAGWKYNETTKQPSETYEVTASGNITFTAQWTANPICTVTLHANGADDIVTEVLQGATYNIPNAGTIVGYTFLGWATAAQNSEVTEAINVVSSFTPEVQAVASTKEFYAVYTRQEGVARYEKVTSDLGTAWAGDYLIACHPTIFANGQKGGKDDNGSIGKADVKVDLNESIVNNTIAAEYGDPYKVTLEEISANSNTYVLKTQDGKYNYQTTYDNGLVASSNKATASFYPITVTFTSEDDVKLVLGGDAAGVAFRYNASNRIFRYYKNAGMSPIYLYKYIGATTYYTTNPAVNYNVSYALGDGAWREAEGCDASVVEAETVYDVVCEYEPVLANKVFDKWQVNEADIELPYTINANTTFTAVYRDAVQYAVNYDANGGVGSAPAATNVLEAADYTVLANAWFFRSGHTFIGWNTASDGSGVAYAAEAVMAMPSANVTLYAQWQELPTNNKEVVIVAKVGANYYAMGQTLSTKQFNAIAVAGVRDNKVILPDGFSDENKTAITWHMITNNNGVTAAFYSPANNKYLAGGNDLSLSNDPVDWTWDNENQCYVISGRTFMYRSSYDFRSYSTSNFGTSGYAEAMYVTTEFAKAITTADATEAGLSLGDNVVVKDGATLTIGSQQFINDVVVENGGNLTLNANLSVHDLVIHSTLGKGTGTTAQGNAPGNCGQIANGSNLTVNGNVYLELELTQDAAASAGWYAFSVPFPVDAINGVYYGNTKLQNEVGYAIMSHYGDLRAKNEYAWKKFRGIMQPGVFYVITVGNTDYKTLRFKKVADEALVASTTVPVSPFPSQTGNDADGAWNGIGNPNLAISNLSTAVPTIQFYDHKTNSFTGRHHSMNLVVGSAFFIQYDAASTVSIPAGTTDHNGYLAPKRVQNDAENTIYEVNLTNVTSGEMEDNLFLTAREDATSEYEIGRDVAKMSMGTAKCAQMWVPAYGTKLCAADFQLVNNQAEYPLTINAPQAGTYSIAVPNDVDATIYLTYEGSIIWDLTASAYEIDLTKGTTEGYGLILRTNAPSVVTGVENGGMLNGANGVQKVIIDEHVYILRGGQMYDVNGKIVK